MMDNITCRGQTFKIHKEDNGYWAECIGLEGCDTQADTLEELNSNIKEALSLYWEEYTQAGIIKEMRLKNYLKQDGE